MFNRKNQRSYSYFITDPKKYSKSLIAWSQLNNPKEISFSNSAFITKSDFNNFLAVQFLNLKSQAYNRGVVFCKEWLADFYTSLFSLWEHSKIVLRVLKKPDLIERLMRTIKTYLLLLRFSKYFCVYWDGSPIFNMYSKPRGKRVDRPRLRWENSQAKTKVKGYGWIRRSYTTLKRKVFHRLQCLGKRTISSNQNEIQHNKM